MDSRPRNNAPSCFSWDHTKFYCRAGYSAWFYLPVYPDRPACISKRLIDFIAEHATNMWLIHMFFYMIYFPEFIYSPRYVLPIFVLLVGVTVLSSYVVKLIEKPAMKILFPSQP